MWGDIEGGSIDAVAIYRADRLHRQPRELEAFIDLCNAVGLTNVASVSGDLDLTTHEGQLVARITGAVAKNESDVKSARIRRQKEQAAEQGKVSGGGTRAYGWETDKTDDPCRRRPRSCASAPAVSWRASRRARSAPT